MKRALAALSLLCASAAAAADPQSAAASRQLTSAASELLALERKIAPKVAALQPDPGEDAGSYPATILYEDVISLLDAAIQTDADNLHARALLAQVLLVKSVNADGSYDVCTLHDARDAAALVAAKKTDVTRADLDTAQQVLKKIEAIPPSLIPDPPESCGDSDDGAPATRAKKRV